MSTNRIKYGISIIVLLLVAYNSVYFKKLSVIKAVISTNEFNSAVYAKHYWESEITPAINNAIELSELIHQLNTNTELAFVNYSHALGIGNIKYFFTKGEGKIIAVDEDEVNILVNTGTGEFQITMATEFIYGNAVRDAIGAINLNDFSNTMNLNNVSTEINKIIRETVVPPFKEKAKEGDMVSFAGAIELNQKFIDLHSIEIVPVYIKIISQ